MFLPLAAGGGFGGGGSGGGGFCNSGVGVSVGVGGGGGKLAGFAAAGMRAPPPSVESLPQLAHSLAHGTEAEQLEAATQLRRMLSVERLPPIDEVRKRRRDSEIARAQLAQR
jgi:hypothetical protein